MKAPIPMEMHQEGGQCDTNDRAAQKMVADRDNHIISSPDSVGRGHDMGAGMAAYPDWIQHHTPHRAAAARWFG